MRWLFYRFDNQIEWDLLVCIYNQIEGKKYLKKAKVSTKKEVGDINKTRYIQFVLSCCSKCKEKKDALDKVTLVNGYLPVNEVRYSSHSLLMMRHLKNRNDKKVKRESAYTEGRCGAVNLTIQSI